MTVYVVTSGEYSGYSIDAIFSTREKAIEYMGDPSQYNDIEEMELDGEPPQAWRKKWVARLRLDGSISSNSEWDRNGHMVNVSNDQQMMTERGHGEISEVAFAHVGQDYDAFIGVSFVGFDHAVKLAVECRQEWMRANPGRRFVKAWTVGVNIAGEPHGHAESINLLLDQARKDHTMDGGSIEVPSHVPADADGFSLIDDSKKHCFIGTSFKGRDHAIELAMAKRNEWAEAKAAEFAKLFPEAIPPQGSVA